MNLIHYSEEEYVKNDILMRLCIFIPMLSLSQILRSRCQIFFFLSTISHLKICASMEVHVQTDQCRTYDVMTKIIQISLIITQAK